jgi:hypothetical protein
MLSFEIINGGRGIQIDCDEQGTAILIAALNRVQEAGHLHLLTPANGGRELNEQNPRGKETIGEVIITWAGD